MKPIHAPAQSKLNKLADLMAYVLAAILVLIPFHAFLTISLAGLTGNYEALRLWKEALLLLLAPLAVVLVWKTPALWQRIRYGWLFWCIAAYALLHIGLGLAALAKGQVNQYAMIYAWVVNLRFLLVFVIALVIATRVGWLYKNWHKLLLWPAVAVIAFGLLQLFVLPIDFLRQFGYGDGTIMPFETVDQKLDYIRIQSTLRGANPLGAYLVVVLAALTALLLRRPQEKQQAVGVTVFSATLIVLMATYSRSAYIGAFIAVMTAVLFVLHGKQARRRLAIGLVAFTLLAGSLAIVFRDNDRFENTFFHTDENSSSPASSNEHRASAIRSGVADVVSEPFGRGPGTAGPASLHNVYPERIAENYYLQIGQEVGWLGLGLFLAINCLVARELWRRRNDVLARALLASLAGIAVINVLQHAWTDDTLAIVWWGLAGIALTPAILSLKSTPLKNTNTDEARAYAQQTNSTKKTGKKAVK